MTPGDIVRLGPNVSGQAAGFREAGFGLAFSNIPTDYWSGKLAEIADFTYAEHQWVYVWCEDCLVLVKLTDIQETVFKS